MYSTCQHWLDCPRVENYSKPPNSSIVSSLCDINFKLPDWTKISVTFHVAFHFQFPYTDPRILLVVGTGEDIQITSQSRFQEEVTHFQFTSHHITSLKDWEGTFILCQISEKKKTSSHKSRHGHQDWKTERAHKDKVSFRSQREGIYIVQWSRRKRAHTSDTRLASVLTEGEEITWTSARSRWVLLLTLPSSQPFIAATADGDRIKFAYREGIKHRPVRGSWCSCPFLAHDSCLWS